MVASSGHKWWQVIGVVVTVQEWCGLVCYNRGEFNNTSWGLGSLYFAGSGDWYRAERRGVFVITVTVVIIGV
jgi:hypothetical protein